MKFIVSASTDAGIVKTINQDSMNVQLLEMDGRQLVLAVLCDGMGGLQQGELASASVVFGFRRWREERLPALLRSGLQDCHIRREWNELISACNEKLVSYGQKNGVRLGTTVVAMLITQERFFAVNVGDSRAYELQDRLRQITKDQTIVAREIEQGYLSPRQAEQDPRRSILLQCVGASREVYPEFYFGVPCREALYMLCSDGFRHRITEQEMWAGLAPGCMCSEEDMRQNELLLIDQVKRRGERDNITVVTIRAYGGTAAERSSGRNAYDGRGTNSGGPETLVDIGYCCSKEIIV